MQITKRLHVKLVCIKLVHVCFLLMQLASFKKRIEIIHATIEVGT